MENGERSDWDLASVACQARLIVQPVTEHCSYQNENNDEMRQNHFSMYTFSPNEK